jgi:predicted nucleotidyltransferase
MKVQTKRELLDQLDEHARRLKEFGVVRCGLFGSFAREEQTAESDIDLLVEFEPEKKTFDNFINLSFFLEELLGRKVEIVTRESLSPFIGPHILREVEYAAVSA